MKDYSRLLADLANAGALRQLPEIVHNGKYIEQEGRSMLNLSSNDYLGLAGRSDLHRTFLDWLDTHPLPFSSSSSRLLTGNYSIYKQLETQLAERFEREAALLFNSGYHANTGILPAIADKRTLIVADKLVHASLIDGILLSGSPFKRYKHNDYDHLERIVAQETPSYDTVIVVTESLFSMDGDTADLTRLVALKKKYPSVLLYVDEAHAVGVRGATGLGIAEEQHCLQEIDLLVGTFGKALASMGAYVVCDRILRDYLVNTMRPLIFSTALPPVQIAWTSFLFERLPTFDRERRYLAVISQRLRSQIAGKGGERSRSHIVPYLIGANEPCLQKAEELQRKGFYCLAVRPPTVPPGTSRLRLSLTAAVDEKELQQLFLALNEKETVEPTDFDHSF